MLQVALRTNTAGFIEEFVDHPNSGHMALLEFMLDLPKAASIQTNNPLLARVPVRDCARMHVHMQD